MNRLNVGLIGVLSILLLIGTVSAAPLFGVRYAPQDPYPPSTPYPANATPYPTATNYAPAGQAATPTPFFTATILEESAPSIFHQLELWAQHSGAPPVEVGNRHGYQTATLIDDSTTAFNQYRLAANIPHTADQCILITVAREPTAAATFAIRPRGGNGEILINLASGAAAVTQTLDAEIVEANVYDDILSYRIRVGANPIYQLWQLIPAYTPDETTTASDVAFTGTVDLITLDLNHSDCGAGDSAEFDIFIGHTFFSIHNAPAPGLLYGCNQYQWADNPKLQAIHTAAPSAYIIDNGDGTFNVECVDEFIRASSAPTLTVGTYISDTTAVNGLVGTFADDGPQNINVATRQQGGNAGRNQSFTTRADTVALSGDSETAPPHRVAYFGIYGDR